MKKIGIYNENFDSKGGGEKVSLALAEVLSKEYDVCLISSKPINIDELADYFNLDLTKVKFEVISRRRTLTEKIIDKLILPGGIKSFFKDYSFYKVVRKKNYDIFINNTHQSNFPNPAKKGVYMCMFPQRLDNTPPTNNPIKKIYRSFVKLLYRVLMFKGKRNAINTYDYITANSKFTQKYIKKYWGEDSRILYPICESMKNSEKKEEIILNVGRFFGDRDLVNHKRQDFLLKTFISSGLHKKGWQLHFAGSVEESPNALKYILNLQKQAKGYPVYFHFDCPFSDLKSIFNKATIYWHSTGFGSDPEKFPEKQEHFGITTVEAISAACIPVVINSAGQQEIVENNKNGFLWSTPEELTQYTEKAINLGNSEINFIRKNGESVVKEFNKNSFEKNVDLLFSSLEE